MFFQYKPSILKTKQVIFYRIVGYERRTGYTLEKVLTRTRSRSYTLVARTELVASSCFWPTLVKSEIRWLLD